MAQALGSLSSGVPLSSPSVHPQVVLNRAGAVRPNITPVPLYVLRFPGGFVRRSILHICGPFSVYLQLPPPPGNPDYPPTAIEQFFMLFLALVLIFALVLLVLPEKLRRQVIKIVFCIGPKGRL